MRHLVSLIVAASLISPSLALACGASTPPRFDGATGGFEGGVSISVGRLADRVWVPVVIGGKPVPKGADLWLTVAFDGAVEGYTGCNRFTGTADLDAGELVLGPIAVTEMACAEPGRMEQEAAFLKALGEVRGFVVAPGGLWLSRVDGSVAVCLR